MGLAVVLLEDYPEELSLGARAAAALAGLGVTSVTLVSDGSTSGLVLEGWAFDERRAADAAAAAVCGLPAAATLGPIVQLAVSAAGTGGRDEEDDTGGAHRGGRRGR